MKKSIVVIDPSIMIHKIVQLAFPEEQHDVLIYDNYPVEGIPTDGISLVLLSADLPGHDDVVAVATEIKSKWNCQVLLMIPKFFEFDTSRALEAGVDAIIEKPFTSDALREKVADMVHVPEEVHEMDSLSPDELESIADDEFMLSEEDLMEIGEEELADVDIPEDLDLGSEPETEDLPDTGELLAEPPPLLEDESEELPIEEALPERPAVPEQDLPLQETTEPGGGTGPEEAPFDNVELGEELDSIDFGDLDEGDQLLSESDLPAPPVASEPKPEVGPETVQEAAIAEGMNLEAETTSPEPAAVMPSSEKATPDETAPEAEPVEVGQETEAAPDVNFAVAEEPQTVQVGEYRVDHQAMVESEPTPEPIDLSHDETDNELLLPPSGVPTPTAGSQLTETDIEQIAERVVQKLSDKAIRDIAWEVIPLVAEEVVKRRIRELEQEDVDS